MRPKIRIAEPEGFSDAALRRLQTVADVRLEPCAPGALSNALQETDVFWFRLGHRIDAEVLGERPRCRILATPVTGLDHIDLEACAARGVRVVSLKGEYEFLREVRATAELAVGLALALLRHIPRAAADVLEGHWRRDRFRGRELYHKTAGIVGVGRLGGIVAEYLAALGMEVLGYDPRPDLPACVERVATLDELFARCDLVSVHAVYQADTHHLIDAQVLAASRPGLVLINTARGGLIDGDALLAALESGRLAGAALDVVAGEPDLGRDHALLRYAREHSNLLIVPHIGGNTFESFEKTECFLAERVCEALAELELGDD